MGKFACLVKYSFKHWMLKIIFSHFIHQSTAKIETFLPNYKEKSIFYFHMNAHEYMRVDIVSNKCCHQKRNFSFIKQSRRFMVRHMFNY